MATVTVKQAPPPPPPPPTFCLELSQNEFAVVKRCIGAQSHRMAEEAGFDWNVTHRVYGAMNDAG